MPAGSRYPIVAVVLPFSTRRRQLESVGVRIMALTRAEFFRNPPSQYAHLSPAYGWRVYRAEQQGFSRSQARGHPSKLRREQPITVVRIAQAVRKQAEIEFKRAGYKTNLIEFAGDDLPSFYREIKNQTLRPKGADSAYAVVNYTDESGNRRQARTKAYASRSWKELDKDFKKIVRKYQIRKRMSTGTDDSEITFEIHYNSGLSRQPD